MKKLLAVISLSIFMYGATNHTFLTNKYNKEIELEAKIVSNIAKNIINSNIKIYIPQINKSEKDIYSKYFDVVDSCEKANFTFIKDSRAMKKSCNKKARVYFTNSYRTLIKDDKFIGAFFWSKSRPNVIFLQDRLDKYSISLPNSYDKYIEDF